MKRILFALAVLLGALLVAAPAQAASANFTHLSPDEGYNGAFNVTCSGGGVQTLYEGQSSSCGGGVVGIYVFPGSKVVCKYTAPNGQVTWYTAFTAGGHSTQGTLSTKCVTQVA